MTEDGKITIPEPIRQHLGLQPGSKIDFRQLQSGEVVLVANEPKSESFFAKFLGHAGPGMSTDEVMAMTRGED
ncbi:AbrB family transcriptional regulator [Devosia chinhatensis]|uniref:AbrB family transcriptional regulator n=2 Tax=Devosia aurantiaca TaxID=2714858 RepID=A0A6M1SJR5_9HYPH|nr:AbrB family transcriptional regulator [Devosia aurantiaca]